MSTSQNKAIVERIFDVFNSQDFSPLDTLVAPEYVNYSMPAPAPGPEGLKAVLTQFRNAFPDMFIERQMIVCEGDLVATSGYWTGTHKGEFMGMPATGKSVKVGFMDFWKVKDGKAVENWVQMDNTVIAQQLGMVAQPA